MNNINYKFKIDEWYNLKVLFIREQFKNICPFIYWGLEVFKTQLNYTTLAPF